MKFRVIKNSTFLLAFTACFLHASESLNQKTWFAQAMDSIGQSSFMHAYSKYVQTKIDGFLHTVQNYGDQSASPYYQELGSQAQCALCTPQDHHLPIKNVDSTIIPAVADSDAIYVNEKMFDKRTYGSQRSSIFHEATHAKYHDSAMSGMLKQAGFWGGTLGTYAALKTCNIVKFRKSLSCTAGLALMVYATAKYKCFMEKRADIQGHYGTQCSSCVYEEIEQRDKGFEEVILAQQNTLKLIQEKNLNSKFSPPVCSKKDIERLECLGGYLTQAELQQIAQDLGSKKCSYHSQQK